MSDDLINENYSDPFIQKVVKFIASDSFQIKFSDQEEHEFFYYELYQEFQDMFDQELLQFCSNNSITKEIFYKLCQDAIENDEKANHYIQILLSSVEYETFVRLMRIMKPIAEIKLKNQQNKSDDDERKNLLKGISHTLTPLSLTLSPSSLSLSLSLHSILLYSIDSKGNEEIELDEYSSPSYQAESKSSGASHANDHKSSRKATDDEEEDADVKDVGSDAKYSRK